MGEWRETTLGEILGAKGYIRGPFGSSLKRNDMKSSGTPVYEQMHAIYGHRKFRFFVDDEKLGELSRFQVKPNDLIISCSGTVGRISTISNSDPKGIISQALLILRPDTSLVRPQFLKYFLTSELGQHHLLSASHGSVQPNISERKIVEKIPVDLPDPDTQDLIVEVLSSLDDKIEILQHQNKTLEQLAETLFRQWFVVNELDETLTTTLGEQTTILRGLSYKGAGLTEQSDLLAVPMINLNSVFEGGHFKESGTKYYNGDFKERHLIFPGDVFVTNTEQGHEHRLIGHAAIVPRSIGERAIFSQHVYRIVPKNNALTPAFLYHLFNHSPMRDQVIGATNGSTVNMLSLEGLERCTFSLPDGERLTHFNTISGDHQKKIEANNEQIKTLAGTRDLILPKLMSGEIRVVEAAEQILETA
ncbi:restriction endonuclease subunit S [Flaviaesturariibacter aridisoli]|uniref:Restriction endonuclease subunit S n=1 Tax=Flaviaesturariibacter aridisoli TaxID=2545761 RepID=A0A4R4E2Y7_9BACT|nr:restriction endonuclease subunit S [Flaviaesturariibacter aridisoli]TCZ73277.1 restriction endonuclease subunit S [Flaviaesturariibacter aridisoli]